MQLLFDIMLRSLALMSELRPTVGLAAGVALAMLAAWAGWQLTDLVVARRQRFDED